MVKIQVPDGFDLDSLPDFPPNGQDSAEICTKCQLQFLWLMALPVIEESSYLGLHTHSGLSAFYAYLLGGASACSRVRFSRKYSMSSEPCFGSRHIGRLAGS